MDVFKQYLGYSGAARVEESIYYTWKHWIDKGGGVVLSVYAI